MTLRGKEEEVKKFYNKLKDDLAGNPITFLPLNPISDIEISTDRFYHRLQCEQMGKFVDVGFSMKKSIDSLPENMAKVLAKLKKEGLL